MASLTTIIIVLLVLIFPPQVGSSLNHPLPDPKVNAKQLIIAVLVLLLVSLFLYAIVYIREIVSWIRDKLCPGQNGLVLDIQRSIPMQPFSEFRRRMEESGPELDCAICLSEFSDDEMVRLLPGCNHAFHAECIDVWLASHQTCPLCRASVQL